MGNRKKKREKNRDKCIQRVRVFCFCRHENSEERKKKQFRMTKYDFIIEWEDQYVSDH